MRQKHLPFAAVFVILVSGACDSSAQRPRLTVDPDPIRIRTHAAVPPIPATGFSADWTVDVADTAGIGGVVRRVSTTIRDQNAQVVARVEGAGRGLPFTQVPVASNGTASVAQGFDFLGAGIPRDYTFHVDVSYRDNEGNDHRLTADVGQEPVPTPAPPS